MTQKTKSVELKGVSKVYPAQSRKDLPIYALEDVTIDIYQGEFVAFVGPSGCGKTTILRLISGLLPKTSGTVIINGSLVDNTIPEVGIVFQTPVLLQWRKVLGNIMLPAEILGLDKERCRRKAYELLDLVGLKGFENKYPFQLSGGMQQRVSICRALIHDPPALIMDEPFSALDEITRDNMNVELLRIWTEKKKTIIYITHSISEAVFLSDRVAVMAPRPSKVVAVVDIDLPRPRDLRMRTWPHFAEMVELIREKMGLHSTLPATRDEKMPVDDTKPGIKGQ